VQTEAAVLWEIGDRWRIEQIDLDPPKQGEVLVRIAASGMCHSDEHVVTGDLPFAVPVVGGHEGAGVVEEVGPNVVGLKPGDHVVFSFIPACGRCPSCATGHSNLCDLGQYLGTGRQISDQTSRHHANGTDLGITCLIGTFCKYTVVNEASCIKIDDEVPLDKACLVGCGVTTGWGAAVYAAGVKPGDDVVVVGIGGIGANALQGARLAGAERIFAVDPVEWKRKQAKRFGATHVAPGIDEAFGVVSEATQGRMANAVIATMGVGRGDLLAGMLALAAKRGKVVVTNIHPASELQATVSLLDLTLMEKRIVGSLFGSANPRSDIPKLLALYRQGHLDLDGLITRTYKLEDVNQGYQDMRDGRNIRGVLQFE
jgi:S-(hydroxymethyl)glutathione dehydrogenase/alcohol dehydrogenase